MESRFLNTPIGVLRYQANETGLKDLRFVSESGQNDSDSPLLLEAERQLSAYFAGRLRAFDLPLAPEGTDFQKQVWAEVSKIPFGQTVAYIDVANRLNNPLAVRAVGAANGQNPIWIVIPCHRIVGRNGQLTGYAGGLERKQWLLDHEQKLAGGVLF